MLRVWSVFRVNISSSFLFHATDDQINKLFELKFVSTKCFPAISYQSYLHNCILICNPKLHTNIENINYFIGHTATIPSIPLKYSVGKYYL